MARWQVQRCSVAGSQLPARLAAVSSCRPCTALPLLLQMRNCSSQSNRRLPRRRSQHALPPSSRSAQLTQPRKRRCQQAGRWAGNTLSRWAEPGPAAQRLARQPPAAAGPSRPDGRLTQQPPTARRLCLRQGRPAGPGHPIVLAPAAAAGAGAHAAHTSCVCAGTWRRAGSVASSTAVSATQRWVGSCLFGVLFSGGRPLLVCRGGCFDSRLLRWLVV